MNTFSVFPSRKPRKDDICDPKIPVVTVTPVGRCDLRSSLYQENECALMDADGDIVDYEYKEEYIADDRENDLEYLKEAYGYNISMMHVEEPFDEYPSIYHDDDIVSNISSVVENAVLYNCLLNLPDWLSFHLDQINEYDIHKDPLAFDQAVRNCEAE